jgi:hypothetical protein
VFLHSSSGRRAGMRVDGREIFLLVFRGGRVAFNDKKQLGSMRRKPSPRPSPSGRGRQEGAFPALLTSVEDIRLHFAS